MSTIEIVIYATDTGKEPFFDWQDKLEKRMKAVVMSRLDRVRLGNFGDSSVCSMLLGFGSLESIMVQGIVFILEKKDQELLYC